MTLRKTKGKNNKIKRRACRVENLLIVFHSLSSNSYCKIRWRMKTNVKTTYTHQPFRLCKATNLARNA